MNIKEKKKEKDETVTDDIRGLPVDRGYAWVIAVACLFCNIICLGMQRAYGVLLVEIFRMFQTSAGVTTTILTVQSCVVSIAGLLTQTVVLSFLSVRQTVVIGGFLGGLGLILSYFAQTVFMLYFTISLLVGLSMAMVFGPTLVIVGTYFCQRRSLASAIAVLGGNIGSTVMPLYLQTLISTFGGRGALLVVGATYWHVMVGGLLLRPLHLNKTRKCTEDKLKPRNSQTEQTPAPARHEAAQRLHHFSWSTLMSVRMSVRCHPTKVSRSSITSAIKKTVTAQNCR
ncbi:monocarboxylate transporter 12-B-like [Pomacea canaliculata]|uniref:monocarboxylate transporter 12-B-like n=1 Tax=Pomacea canaliculata TaxID=400727 RepID=UPI000D733A8E|nr:monocarboxylate transporter 12-B-like [Pomacea canaliculata]